MPHNATIDPNQSFARKKAHILEQLSVPESSYIDASPKGTIDVEIRDLIDTVNSYTGLVTTSSCSGRISVFLEGENKGPRSKFAAVEELDVTLQLPEQPPESHDDCIDTADHNGSAEKENHKKKPTSASKGGGKGGGGRWLYVSHSPLLFPDTDDHHHNEYPDSTHSYFTHVFNLSPPLHTPSIHKTAILPRLVHFKFEPLILHILSSTISDAQKVLSAAQQAGFRESGATSLPSDPNPESLIHDQEGKKARAASPIMVAIRSTGLALDCIIGVATAAPALNHYHNNGNDDAASREEPVLQILVTEQHLRLLVSIANDRFKTNTERTERLRNLLKKEFAGEVCRKADDGVWEDVCARRERKRREGSRQQRTEKVVDAEVFDLEVVFG